MNSDAISVPTHRVRAKTALQAGTVRTVGRVARIDHSEGVESSWSLIRASLVVKCHSATAWVLFRWRTPASTWLMIACLSGMRRSRHCEARTPSSDSAKSEPGTVFRRVMPFEALDEPPGLGGGKGFVERCGGVGVEIILDEDDRFGLREVDVGQVFQNVGVIDSGAAVGDLDCASLRAAQTS